MRFAKGGEDINLKPIQQTSLPKRYESELLNFLQKHLPSEKKTQKFDCIKLANY
jgi:hypothetical protein